MTGAKVVSDRVVVESGKLVSSSGLGVDGALRILSRLHGPAWADVVRLNMEHEPLPAENHVPRASLADVKPPRTVYSAYSWREAELLTYDGDRQQWAMDWRFTSTEAFDSLIKRFREALGSEDGWSVVSDETSQDTWTSEWSIQEEDGPEWHDAIRLHALGAKIDLQMKVARLNGSSNSRR